MSGLSNFEPPQYAYNLLAEQSLLKIALDGDPLAVQLCGELCTSFWNQQHALLGGVLSRMQAAGQHIDQVTAMSQIVAQGLVTKLTGPFLHSIASGPGDHSGVVWYADQIREMAARRRLQESAQHALQHMEHGWATGEDLCVGQAITEFRAALDDVERTRNADHSVTVQSMAEFLDGPTEEDWLVPGLLERMERIILTGGEGLGKSVLCTQLGACMAGGVHPFSGHILGRGDRGIRVTVIDAENSAVQSRRRWGRMIRQVDAVRVRAGLAKVDWKSQVSIDIRPEGLDLLRMRDVSYVEHMIAATFPDLVVIGPLYKMFEADPSDEKAVRQVAAVLDGLRARHRFALLIEAHPGKGEGADGARRMAPIGSSMWMRWPEYGFGIRRARAAQEHRAELVDVVSWRGTREDRQWPRQLAHAKVLPWLPAVEQPREIQAARLELDEGDQDGRNSDWYR